MVCPPGPTTTLIRFQEQIGMYAPDSYNTRQPGTTRVKTLPLAQPQTLINWLITGMMRFQTMIMTMLPVFITTGRWWAISLKWYGLLPKKSVVRLFSVTQWQNMVRILSTCCANIKMLETSIMEHQVKTKCRSLRKMSWS